MLSSSKCSRQQKTKGRMLFDIKVKDKGKGTCSTGRAAALPIQQLGETTMKTKPDTGVHRRHKRLLISHISNYLSPPAAKPALFQQLQNIAEMLYQCPLMSHLSGLLIFDVSNTEHEDNQVLLIEELPTNSRNFFSCCPPENWNLHLPGTQHSTKYRFF